MAAHDPKCRDCGSTTWSYGMYTMQCCACGHEERVGAAQRASRDEGVEEQRAGY